MSGRDVSFERTNQTIGSLPMRSTVSNPSSITRGSFVGAVLAVLLASLAVSGCETLLDVEENPKEVPAEALDDPDALQARLIGAEADFWLSYDMFIVYQGLFTDELLDATGVDQVEERRVQPSNGLIGAVDESPEGIDGLWTPVQRAVATTDLLQEDILAGSFPDQIPNPQNSPELARMSMFNGYAKLALGEAFCTTAFGGTGPELTSQETYQLAEEEFTLAIDATNAGRDVRLAALVGRSRARLQQGELDGALQDARQVPLDWEFVGSVYSTNSQKEQNDIWNMLTDSQRFSVDSVFRPPLTIDDTDKVDPRLDIFQDPNDPFAIDGVTELWQIRKYSFPTAPIRLASGVEAQYIVAEIEGGQTAVDIINRVREFQGIEEDFQSSDSDEILRKVISERSRSLFMEGNRMGNLRRYRERFGIDLFPTGPGFGDQTCMPLPDAERDNNPGLSG